MATSHTKPAATLETITIQTDCTSLPPSLRVNDTEVAAIEGLVDAFNHQDKTAFVSFMASNAVERHLEAGFSIRGAREIAEALWAFRSLFPSARLVFLRAHHRTDRGESAVKGVCQLDWAACSDDDAGLASREHVICVADRGRVTAIEHRSAVTVQRGTQTRRTAMPRSP